LVEQEKALSRRSCDEEVLVRVLWIGSYA
jgi:hypothetical protein